MKWLWCSAKNVEPGNVALSGKIGIVAHETNDQAYYITELCKRGHDLFAVYIK
jgi:hypothetical protein